MKQLIIFFAMSIYLFSCETKEETSDAYGNFEVDKTLISAESQGKLLFFDIEEGDILKEGDTVGQIDTLAIHYKKEQLLAQLSSLRSGFTEIDAQLEVAKQQMKNLEVSQKRIQKLFASGAATQKQVDDINGRTILARKQVEAVNTRRASLRNKIKAMENQLKEILYTISRSTIINPVNGTVLSKLAMAKEIAAPGKPLYAIGDLSNIKLRVYVSGNILPKVKIGNTATVIVDDGNGNLKKTKGKIIWISSSAEFTPKTIQTRDERVNLVYAVKILVENDGSLKIGMPGEAKF